MVKALKGTMTAYGAVGLVFGLAYVLFPRQAAELFGVEDVTPYLLSTKTALGASLVAIGIFVIIAARDPIKNSLWVKYSITFAFFFFAVAVYSIVAGYTDFAQSIVGLIIHAAFGILQIVFYRLSDLS